MEASGIRKNFLDIGNATILYNSVAAVNGELYQLLSQTVQPHYQYTLTGAVAGANADWAIELYAFKEGWATPFILGTVSGLGVSNDFNAWSVSININQK
jgi:hypothetical protein